MHKLQRDRRENCETPVSRVLKDGTMRQSQAQQSGENRHHMQSLEDMNSQDLPMSCKQFNSALTMDHVRYAMRIGTEVISEWNLMVRPNDEKLQNWT